MTENVFISYSHADDELIDRLHKHLTQLKREGSITGWYDREITAGGRIDKEITENLSESSIFLACMSPDFIASEYCYDNELKTALERENAGTLIIIPIVLEPCDWLSTPLKKFKASPKDGKPISEFTNQNAAFMNVVTDIRKLISATKNKMAKNPTLAKLTSTGSESEAISRYRVKRDFDDLDKRDFIESSFKEIYRFFQDSAAEISEIPDIETRLTELNTDHFACTVINRGLKRGFETLHVRMGGSFGEINILFGEDDHRSTSHGGFRVHKDEFNLSFSSLYSHLNSNVKSLSSNKVAQILWDDLLSKVGVEYH